MSGEKRAPELPEIVDEAGESARWVPHVGLALLGVLLLVVVIRLFTTQPAAPSEAEQPAAAVAP